MTRVLACTTFVLLALTSLPVGGQERSLPDLDTAAIASGPYSRLHMLLEKTVLDVNVLTVDIRVGEPTRKQFEQLVRSGARGERFVQQVAAAAMDAEQVLVTLEFQRNVSFNQWLDGVRESLEKARAAGLIDQPTFRNVSDGLPQWFQVKAARGFVKGDRIIYRGYPDRMRALVVSPAGTVEMDRVDQGATPRRSMLAGYFAPGTDFRNPLAESLLAP